MNLLMILNRMPYDGTDVVWNGLRLISQSMKMGVSVKLFIMNDAVELANKDIKKEEAYDLPGMLFDSISSGAEVRICETCLKRAGIGLEKVMDGVVPSDLSDLVNWIKTADKILTL